MPSGYLKSVMDTVIDGVIIIDDAGTIQAFNTASERIFGYKPADVVGRNVKMLIPDPYHAGLDGYIRTYRATGDKDIAGIGREVAGRRRDGSVFPMELGVNDMQVGGAHLFVGTVRDISARQRAEASARAEAARMQAVMNTVPDALITIDETGTVEHFNAAAMRIFGYTADEVLGRNIRMLMPEPYQAEHDAHLAHYLQTGAAHAIGNGRELRARRKDGTIFPIEIGVNEVQTVGKRLFVGTIRDISERQQAETEIHDYIAALSRSNQELDDFAYIASHDLKEALRGLSNNALFLSEDFAGALGEAGARRTARMIYLCERMDRLINDLLYYSRLGRQDLAIQPTDLNAVIADIAMMMEGTLEDAGAKILVPVPLPTVVCDLPRVTEVFRNLITNAVKYNDKAEKHIEIGCTAAGARQIFHVRDDGIGIEPKFHQEIFRIFKRLNDEDDGVKGNGVGLTFVKKIIERHGGDIWVSSELGRGATFHFTLEPNPEH
jgi:PAS domain S-box-containing protein